MRLPVLPLIAIAALAVAVLTYDTAWETQTATLKILGIGFGGILGVIALVTKFTDARGVTSAGLVVLALLILNTGLTGFTTWREAQEGATAQQRQIDGIDALVRRIQVVELDLTVQWSEGPSFGLTEEWVRLLTPAQQDYCALLSRRDIAAREEICAQPVPSDRLVKLPRVRVSLVDFDVPEGEKHTSIAKISVDPDPFTASLFRPTARVRRVGTSPDHRLIFQMRNQPVTFESQSALSFDDLCRATLMPLIINWPMLEALQDVVFAPDLSLVLRLADGRELALSPSVITYTGGAEDMPPQFGGTIDVSDFTEDCGDPS